MQNSFRKKAVLGVYIFFAILLLFPRWTAHQGWSGLTDVIEHRKFGFILMPPEDEPGGVTIFYQFDYSYFLTCMALVIVFSLCVAYFEYCSRPSNGQEG